MSRASRAIRRAPQAPPDMPLPFDKGPFAKKWLSDLTKPELRTMIRGYRQAVAARRVPEGRKKVHRAWLRRLEAWAKYRRLARSRRRKFVANFAVDIEVDQALLDSVLTDEWRRTFYHLVTPEDVASHLAFNLMRGATLSMLDGFADQDEARVTLGGIEAMDTDEIRQPPVHSRKKK